jgi:hypothetical protein
LKDLKHRTVAAEGAGNCSTYRDLEKETPYIIVKVDHGPLERSGSDSRISVNAFTAAIQQKDR